VNCPHCEREGIEQVATVAIATRRPTRANLWTKIWWEESEAPRNAERVCGEHAERIITELTKVLA
jgi:hypothetical protein